MNTLQKNYPKYSLNSAIITLRMKLIDQLSEKITRPATIVFCEQDNADLMIAIDKAKANNIINPLFSDSLETAAKLVKEGMADSMVAGIDSPSRDVIIAVKDIIGIIGETFSSSFIIELIDGRIFVVADCATCVNPNSKQLSDIVIQTVDMAKSVLDIEPKVAMLSYSTLGSGGNNTSIDKIHSAIKIVKKSRPDIDIDGELQLDTAINAEIANKKAPGSSVAGKANILIVPDLNSGNILYKSIEQFAGAKAYGPILQGFNAPVSDLSRGSSIDDIYGSIVITSLRLQKQQRLISC